MTQATIGLWGGSSPAKTQDIQKGLRRLSELNLTPQAHQKPKQWSKPELRKLPFLCDSDRSKAQSFARLWNDSAIKTIFCVRGGYGTLRLLPLFDRMRLRPRRDIRVWGYSDLTTLQHYLFHRFQSPWVHSPMLTSPSFYEPRPIEKKLWTPPPGEKSVTYALHTVVEDRRSATTKRAPLLGGNFTCLMGLMGTPWEPQIKRPYFLFLEDVNEAPYRVDRMLHQLENTRFFKNCCGIILGHFTMPTGSRLARKSIENVFEQWCRRVKRPLYTGLDAGHDRPNYPISMGESATLTQVSKKTAALQIPPANIR